MMSKKLIMPEIELNFLHAKYSYYKLGNLPVFSDQMKSVHAND